MSNYLFKGILSRELDLFKNLYSIHWLTRAFAGYSPAPLCYLYAALKEGDDLLSLGEALLEDPGETHEDRHQKSHYALSYPYPRP